MGPVFREERLLLPPVLMGRIYSGRATLEAARAKRSDALAHPLHGRLHALLDDGLDAITRLARLADELVGDLATDVPALCLGLLELGGEPLAKRLDLALAPLGVA